MKNISNIGDWLIENYPIETMKDVLKYGMVSGFPELMYYTETVKFHDTHEDEIWNLLYFNASQQSLSIMEFISKLNGHQSVGSMDQFKNLLTWYAVEETCRLIIDIRESENE